MAVISGQKKKKKINCKFKLEPIPIKYLRFFVKMYCKNVLYMNKTFIKIFYIRINHVIFFFIFKIPLIILM